MKSLLRIFIIMSAWYCIVRRQLKEMFLDAIDQYHQQSRLDNEIPETNTVFQSEIPVTLSAKHKSFNYIIRKRDKSKMYIVSGKQRVFLTDKDIIDTICKMEACIFMYFTFLFCLHIWYQMLQNVFVFFLKISISWIVPYQ